MKPKDQLQTALVQRNDLTKFLSDGRMKSYCDALSAATTGSRVRSFWHPGSVTFRCGTKAIGCIYCDLRSAPSGRWRDLLHRGQVRGRSLVSFARYLWTAGASYGGGLLLLELSREHLDCLGYRLSDRPVKGRARISFQRHWQFPSSLHSLQTIASTWCRHNDHSDQRRIASRKAPVGRAVARLCHSIV